VSSQVNPSSINAAYPVPGVNQSSQGFRTNFLAIQNNFAQYVVEMNDVINKAIVSAPLTYGANTSINNFGGMQNSNLSLFDFAYTVYNGGNISSSQNIPLNFSNGYVQQYTLTSANSVITPIISNFPGLGYSEIVLDITAKATPQFVNLASITSTGNVYTNGNVGIAGYNATHSNITLTQANVPYTFKFSSSDGNNWVVSSPSTSAVACSWPTGANITGVGNPGDTTGMVAFSTGNIYVCTNNYDGSTVIWKRTALSAV